MTLLRARPIPVQGWVNGVVQDAEPGTPAAGTLAEGADLVPTPAGRLRIRGGSRVVQTLHDDAGAPAELSHVLALRPFTAVGALAIGWSNGQNKHYAYRLTQAMVFATGSEATSRHDMTGTAAASWDNTTAPGRPIMAEVFEKMFVADATETYADRNVLLSITNAGTVAERAFVFGSGAAAVPKPYCIEEYNGVLFMAGYGTEDASDGDRPEYLRHSFLGRSPDAADGFDPDAWLLLGSKGQRITALRKGRGLLLAAKANQLYRISGFGRAYAGWQYQVETVADLADQGLGIANPNALTFAQGWWWGLGEQGPLRTDGFTVESLVGPRRRDWLAIDRPTNAWVAYHPERRLVLFGLHPTESFGSRSATYPWKVWCWDIERNVWQPDLLFGADLFVAAAIESTTGGTVSGSLAPTGPPTSPVTSLETISGYTASWTNGDSAAETEFWEKEGSSGTWALVTVIAAGTATYARTGREDHTEYFWRVRHKKNGIHSAYAADTSAQTLLKPPTITATDLHGIGLSGWVQLDITLFSGGTTLTVERSIASAGSWSGITGSPFASQPEGLNVKLDLAVCGNSYDYRAKATDAAWPTPDSAWSTTATVGPLCS